MPNVPKSPNDPTFSIQSGASDASVDSLDFEHADRTASTARVCAQCGTPITDRYYTLGSHVLCESCHFAFQNATAPGNAVSRFFGAAALGAVAAAMGCAVWMLVTDFTGYEIGLIAIAIGYLVGMAVHLGSRRVGGAAYQVLAVFLTYSAIEMTYVPMIAEQFMTEAGIEQSAQTAASEDSQNAPSGDSNTGFSEGRAEDDTANSARSASAGGDVENPESDPAVDAATAWVAAIPVAYMLPFLMGFENAIGILIIGFALWQAFRMNTRAKIELQGPFRLEARDTALG
jgi:hypothetical protein